MRPPAAEEEVIRSPEDRRGLLKLLTLLLAVLFIASLALITLPGTARAESLVVTDPGDAGPGTLRQAIADANANPGPDTITFAGDMRIFPMTPLPGLNAPQPTTVDGEGYDVVIDGSFMPDDPNSGFDGIGILIRQHNATVQNLKVVNCHDSGIYIHQGGNNRVLSCWLGTSNGVTAEPNGTGLRAVRFTNLTVGEAGSGNLISGNSRFGVYAGWGNGITLQGNTIGLDITGTAPLVNDSQPGVFLASMNNITLGGVAPGEGNYLNDTGQSAAYAVNCSHVQVFGNTTGTDVAGNVALGNGGLSLDGNDIQVGDGTPQGRNLISGYVGRVSVENGSQFSVRGNYFGTNRDGTSRLGHGEVAVAHCTGDALIGGTTPDERNVMASLSVWYSNDVTAIGNYVGLDVTGETPLWGCGVRISDSSYCRIGGSTAGERNIIAGSVGYGVHITGPVSSQNVVSGNFIGTDRNGANPIPNHEDGVRIELSSGNLIGGDIPLEGNVISGNTGSGVFVSGASWEVARNNVISANHIGSSKTGGPVPNGRSGITLGAYAQNNQVGGAGAQEGNAISHNTGDGITLSGEDNYNNAIISNSFGGNGGLAVDLVPDPGPNAPPGSFPYPSVGKPNLWMSLPEITSALKFEGGTKVRGTCVPGSIVRLYRAREDTTGYGEGARYLGWAQCDGAGEFSRENLPLESGESVTALATDRSGNSSEFSRCVTVADRVPPYGSIAINNGAPQTTQSLVKLYLYAYDNATPKAKMKMMVSNSKEFTGASFEAFADKKDWELMPGLGKKTVYVKYKDEARNVSPVYSDDIEVIEKKAPPEKEISPVWYFAEGCTRDPFEEWIIIMNPNGEDAHIDLTLYMPGETVEIKWRVEPYRRGSLHLDSIEDIDGRDVAAKIVATDKYGSPLGVICERTMYWRGPGGEVSPHRDEYHYVLNEGPYWWERVDGHSSVGATSPSKEWYFGEGCTAHGFDTWMLLLNPNEETAHVTLECMTDWGLETIGPLEVPAKSRSSVSIDEHLPAANVSIKVESDIGVVAERSMYWDEMRGGQNSLGVTAPSCEWLMPEGSTAWGFEEWVLVQNPQDETAELKIRLCGDNGILRELELSVEPHSRKTINLNELAPDMDVGTEVTSTNGVPVICERSMYWETGGHKAGHNSTGAQAARDWYLAEGEDLACLDIESYLLIMNPTDEPVTVELYFLGPSGIICWEVIPNIKPHSRYTFKTKEYTADSVFCVEANVVDKGKDKRVAIERAIYWCKKFGGHVTTGYAPPVGER